METTGMTEGGPVEAASDFLEEPEFKDETDSMEGGKDLEV